MTQRISRLGTALILAFVLLAWHGAAADATPAILVFGPSQVAPREEFEVRLSVRSEQPLNAYSAELTYDQLQLEYLGTETGDSLIDVWQEPPSVSAAGSIRFGGASLAAFVGTNGTLFTVRFRALPSFVSTTILTNRSAVYLANGKGTKVLPGTTGLSVFRTDAMPVQAVSAEPLDSVSPVIRSAFLSEDPLNAEQLMLGFSAYDPDTGIAVLEARRMEWFFWSPWVRARNPSVYPKSVWAVQVALEDAVGNRTTAIYYYWPALLLKLAKIGLAILVCVLALRFRRVRRKRKMLY